MAVKDIANSITLGSDWASVSLGTDVHSFYLIGIKEERGASDTINPSDVKRISFEVGIDAGLDEPLSIGFVTLNFDERTSSNKELNDATALVRCTGYPSEFKIRPTQIYTKNECYTEGVTTIGINLNAVNLI